ncbi:hypothetical protein MC885_001887 [Smutsia gigantea]|nr:hypothetical protein MC885_001887 [Smutsia gigantea]
MHKKKGPAGPPGRGAAAALQLGLRVDLSPDGLMIPEDGVNDAELEAEFLALAIEKMASLCMRDPDEDEEEGSDEEAVEADDDLLTAIESARQAGDGAKMRRYDRGLKTLENLLASVREGNAIDEEDIPPPVAVGKGLVSTPSHTPTLPQPAPMNPPAPEPRVPVEGPRPTAPASSLGLAKPQLPSGYITLSLLRVLLDLPEECLEL